MSASFSQQCMQDSETPKSLTVAASGTTLTDLPGIEDVTARARTLTREVPLVRSPPLASRPVLSFGRPGGAYWKGTRTECPGRLQHVRGRWGRAVI
jgi:hypothetical protein